MEEIAVFKCKRSQKPTYNPQGLIKLDKPIIRTRKSLNTDIYGSAKFIDHIQHYTNYPDNYLFYKTPVKRYHPTQKPTDLLEYLIRTYTNPGETVLDNCMGSGSTGVACVNTRRDFIGIELEEKYFNIAKERIENVRNSLEHADASGIVVYAGDSK